MDKTINKRNTLLGFFWSAIEKFGIQGGQFVIGIILARILVPEDFGLLAMIMVFMNVSQVFVESGLTKALIQNKARNEGDFSTVFVFNLVSSALLYGLLFLASPYVAEFYAIPILSEVLKVLGVNLILTSISIIPITRLTIAINFKLIAIVNFAAMLFSGVISIICALKGLGVWSLVIQILLRSFISLLLFWSIYKWNISFFFSFTSFKVLFRYGSKLLFASVYSHILMNMYNVVIGKAYSSTELGCYSRAKGFTEVISNTITSIIHQVSFPVLSALQEEKEKLIFFFKKSLLSTAFVIFPAMTLLSLLSDPIVRVLLNEKWLFVIPLLQWMAFTRVFYPLSSINMNVLTSIGRSDLYLKIEFIKFPIVVIPMLISLSISIKAMVIAQVIASFISFFVNAYLTGKLYQYGPIKQLLDLWPIVIATIVMAVSVYFLTNLIDTPITKLLIGLISGGSVYLGVNYIVNMAFVKDIIDMIRIMKDK